jgi:hypothetical protein
VLLKLHDEKVRFAASNQVATATRACAGCGDCASELKACSRCKAVYYCSKECQSAHWKSGHKAACES